MTATLAAVAVAAAADAADAVRCCVFACCMAFLMVVASMLPLETQSMRRHFAGELPVGSSHLRRRPCPSQLVAGHHQQ